MTKTVRPSETRRIEFSLELGLRNWVQDRVGPGRPFFTWSHAAALGLQRQAEERQAIEKLCQKNRIKFNEDAFRRLHGDALLESVPNERGRPRRSDSAKPHVPRKREFATLDKHYVQWIDAHVQPKGPFVASSPAAHAIEYGLRILQEAGDAPVSSAGIPFDLDGLWTRYRALLKESK